MRDAIGREVIRDVGLLIDGLRGYVQIASGLTEGPRQRALDAVRALATQGDQGVSQLLPADLRAQLTGLAEEALAAGRANRDLVVGLVAGEVERQVARLGLVSAEQLEAATLRAVRLERRVRDLEEQVAAGSSPGGAPVPTTTDDEGASTAPRAVASRRSTVRTEPPEDVARAQGETRQRALNQQRAVPPPAADLVGHRSRAAAQASASAAAGEAGEDTKPTPAKRTSARKTAAREAAAKKAPAQTAAARKASATDKGVDAGGAAAATKASAAAKRASTRKAPTSAPAKRGAGRPAVKRAPVRRAAATGDATPESPAEAQAQQPTGDGGGA